MTAVKISGTFKKDERPLNGLEAIAEELLDRDLNHERYVIVAIVRPHASRWEAEDNTETPTAKLDHIEVLDGPAADTARELLNAAYKARTGKGADPQDTLPFDAGEAEGPVTERPRDQWLAPEARED